MRKFLKPALAVVSGLIASWCLQTAGVEPLVAKLIGLAVALAALVLLWRRSAAL